MKKFGTIILSIYLTITTLASVLFGYLYLSDLLKDSSSISANQLINTVCYDLGLITREQYNQALGHDTTTNSLSATSLEPDTFSKDSIDWNVDMAFKYENAESGGISYSYGLLAYFLAVPRNLLAEENGRNLYNQKTFYKTTALAELDSEEPSDDPQIGTFFGYYTYNGKAFEASVMYLFYYESYLEEETEMPLLMQGDLRITSEDNGGWSMDVIIYNTPTDQVVSKFQQNINAVVHFSAKANSTGIYYASSKLTVDGTHFSNANEIENIFIVEVDLNKHTKLNKQKSDLTDAEIVSQANSVVDLKNDIKRVHFNNVTVQTIDIAEKIWQDILQIANILY